LPPDHVGLVDSTALSTQVEPETYRLVVGRYREQVLHIVNRYKGRIGSTKGDGLLPALTGPAGPLAPGWLAPGCAPGFAETDCATRHSA
jgi:class 3 adenylate cyclase